MIIVEGCDNTGKTTLINSLKKEFNELQSVKSPGPTTTGTALAWISQAIRNEDPRTIYDRYFPISERVYGLTLRGVDIFGSYSWDIITLTLRRQPLIIYCRPPEATVKMWGDQSQMLGVKSHCSELIRRYDWVMDVIKELYVHGGLMIEYDYTDEESKTHSANAVRTYLQTHKMILPRSTT